MKTNNKKIKINTNDDSTKKTRIKRIILYSLFVLLCFGCILDTLYKKNAFHSFPEIEWKDLDNINQYDNVKTYDLIKNIKYGKIISPNKTIDTSIVTKKNIKYIVESKSGKRQIIIITINIKEKKKD